MLPSSPDTRALRIRLLERLSATKAYFEATSVAVGLKSPFWSAFDALRRNQPLAESFVADLQQLLDFLENELVPALSQPAPSVPRPAPPPAAAEAPLSDQETRVINNLPLSVQRDLFAGRPVAGRVASPVRRNVDEPSASAIEAMPIEDVPPPPPPVVTLPAAVAPSSSGPGAGPPPSRPLSAARLGGPAAKPVAAPTPPVLSPERPAEIRLADVSAAEKVTGAQRIVADGPLSKRAAALMVATLDTPPVAPSSSAASPATAPVRSTGAIKVISTTQPSPEPTRPALARPTGAINVVAGASTPAPSAPAPVVKPTPGAPVPAPVAAASSSTAAGPRLPAAAAGKAAAPLVAAQAAPVPATKPAAIVAAPATTPPAPVAASANRPASAAPTSAAAPINTPAVKPVAAAAAPKPQPVAAAKAAPVAAAAPTVQPIAAPVASLGLAAARPSGIHKPVGEAAALQATAAKPAAVVAAPPVVMAKSPTKAVAANPVPAPVAAAPAAKPVAAVTAPAVKPAAKDMPVAAAKPVAGAAAKPISVAKSNAGRSGAKPMPKFDESDVSEPNLSPSQFFRILDAKLDK